MGEATVYTPPYAWAPVEALQLIPCKLFKARVETISTESIVEATLLPPFLSDCSFVAEVRAGPECSPFRNPTLRQWVAVGWSKGLSLSDRQSRDWQMLARLQKGIWLSPRLIIVRTI